MEVCIRSNNLQKKDALSARSVYGENQFITNTRSTSGETALHQLARSQLKSFELIQKEFDEEKDAEERLFEATGRRTKSYVNKKPNPDYPKATLTAYAISCGCEVDAKDNYGRTPLMAAIIAEQDVSIISHLLDADANIYITDFDGMSALRYLIIKTHKWLTTLTPSENELITCSMFFEKIGYEFSVDRTLALQRLQSVGCSKALIPFINNNHIKKYLYENNIMLEERLSGLTALHVAVMCQDIVSAKILIMRGEYINAVDHRNQNALLAHNPFGTGGLERFGILKMLLNNGTSLYTARHGDGKTPMEQMMKFGSQFTVWTVLESNAHILDNCQPYGETALHYLLQNAHFKKAPKDEIISLLRKGFDVNKPDNNGMSALTYCIKHELEEKFGFLLQVGAKANWTDIVKNTTMLDVFMNCSYVKGKSEYFQWIVQIIFLQQGINVRHLFDGLHKGFTKKLDNMFYAQVVIAQLVIDEANGKHIPDATLDYIKSEIIYKVHYEICKERIEEMKFITICDSITFYHLLTESDDKLDRYVSNPEFLTEFKFAMSEKSYQHLYYFVIVRKRIENAVKIKELRKRGGPVIWECTGLNGYGLKKDDDIVGKIVGYLSNRDIQNLFDGPLLTKAVPIPPPRTPKLGGNIFTRAIRKFFARTDE